jgi:hypothetical protein
MGVVGLFAVSQLFLAPSSVSALSTCPEFPFLQPTTGSLAAVNCDFHKQYEKRVNQVVSTFGAPDGRPVIFKLGSTLTLKRDGQVRTANIAPSPFSELKAFAHGTFSVFVILSQQAPDVTWGEATQTALTDLLMNLAAAKADLPNLDLSVEDRLACDELSTATNSYLSGLLSSHLYAQNELASFYERVGPNLTAVLERAAQTELQALDQAVSPWLAEMTPAERGRVGVANVATHQSRAREISVQYFEKKFGFRAGEGAQQENGFVVLEGHFDEKSAAAQLARHYIDREVGQGIFQEPARMQEDLLSKAAAEILRSS